MVNGSPQAARGHRDAQRRKHADLGRRHLEGVQLHRGRHGRRGHPDRPSHHQGPEGGRSVRLLDASPGRRVRHLQVVRGPAAPPDPRHLPGRPGAPPEFHGQPSVQGPHRAPRGRAGADGGHHRGREGQLPLPEPDREGQARLPPLLAQDERGGAPELEDGAPEDLSKGPRQDRGRNRGR